MPVEPGNLSLGVLAGGLIGTFAGHYLTKSRSAEERTISEFNKASAAFRAEFANTIRILRHNELKGDSNIIEIITNETIANQERAKILFEPFVRGADLSSFNEAWKKYVNRYDSEYPRASISNHTEYIKELSQIYLNHIVDLLKFAEPKLS